MKNYYIRPGGAYVRIDNDTKEIINILNHETQKTISKLDNLDYYNSIMIQIQSWEISDETTFNNMYNVVLSKINNLI
jgi:NADH:ubiquinone oxidoreductase subunit D